MKKENISLLQLAAVVFNFQIGSNVAIGLGLNAKEDAWIALLIALFIGIGITYFFIYMTTLAPGKNLFEMFEHCFNRPIAIILSMVYAIYFFYYACRIIRDFGGKATTDRILSNSLFIHHPLAFIKIFHINILHLYRT